MSNTGISTVGDILTEGVEDTAGAVGVISTDVGDTGLNVFVGFVADFTHEFEVIDHPVHTGCP